MYNIYAILGSGSETTPAFEYVNEDVINSIGDLVTTVLGWVTSNPILAIFFTMTMLSLAFVVIGWLKGVIRLK